MNKENHNIMILLKMIGIYQIINPNSLKIKDINIYKVINICLIMLTTTTTVIGICSIFYEMEGSLNNGMIDMQQFFYVASNIVASLKVIMIIHNSDRIWKFFDVTNDLCLFGKHSPGHFYKNRECTTRFVKISYLYVLMFFIAGFLWTLKPIILNISSQNNDYIRNINVSNFSYFITTKIYNTFYSYFYTMEVLMTIYITYGLLSYDLLIIIILPIIYSQYEIISFAFQNLQSIDDEEDGESTFNFK